MLAQQDLSTYRISSWNGAFNSNNKRTLIFCQIVLFKISLGKLDTFLIDPNTHGLLHLVFPIILKSSDLRLVIKIYSLQAPVVQWMFYGCSGVMFIRV